MPTYVVPSWQLANIDPGQLFKNDGKLYMLIGHHALYTEISRYYWFDKLFASAADRIRSLIRRIRIKKIHTHAETSTVQTGPRQNPK